MTLEWQRCSNVRTDGIPLVLPVSIVSLARCPHTLSVLKGNRAEGGAQTRALRRENKILQIEPDCTLGGTNDNELVPERNTFKNIA